MSSHTQVLSESGFFVVDAFLDAPLIQKAIGALESMDGEDPSLRVRRGVAFARRNLLAMDFVRAIIQLPRTTELLSAIACDLRPVRAILFDKVTLANWTVPWHQDRSIAVRERNDIEGFGPWSTKAGVVHVQPPVEILRRMITLRFHLDDCGPDNGPLRVIPQTHHRILMAAEIESRVSFAEQTSCITSAGGLVAMRPLILHASSPATLPSHRRVIHIEFGPPELPGGLRWAADGV